MQEQWNKPCILANHRGLKLDNRNKRKLTNSRKLNNSLRNEKWVKTDIKKEIKNFLELMKMKTQCTQVYRTRWRGFYEYNFEKTVGEMGLERQLTVKAFAALLENPGSTLTRWLTAACGSRSGDATALAPALTCTCTRPHVWQSGQRGIRAKVRTHVSVPSPVDGDSRTQVAAPLHRPLWGPRWLQGSFLSIQFPAEGSDSQRAMAKCSRSSVVKGWVAED